jgi:hypothetical protein
MDENELLVDVTADILERMRKDLEQEMVEELVRKALNLYPSRYDLLKHFAYICSCVAQENFVRSAAARS